MELKLQTKGFHFTCINYMIEKRLDIYTKNCIDVMFLVVCLQFDDDNPITKMAKQVCFS